MRIVVSDSRCLIDLRKAALLDTCLRLPYEFLIPNTLFEEELLRFTAIQKKTLVCSRLKIMDLPGERVLRAQAVVRKFPQISVRDGFAFALAESKPGCILLTGDDKLHTVATQHEMDVRGVCGYSMRFNETTSPRQPLSCVHYVRFLLTRQYDCRAEKWTRISSDMRA